jgi:hypothetical protein
MATGMADIMGMTHQIPAIGMVNITKMTQIPAVGAAATSAHTTGKIVAAATSAQMAKVEAVVASVKAPKAAVTHRTKIAKTILETQKEWKMNLISLLNAQQKTGKILQISQLSFHKFNRQKRN